MNLKRLNEPNVCVKSLCGQLNVHIDVWLFLKATDKCIIKTNGQD